MQPSPTARKASAQSSQLLSTPSYSLTLASAAKKKTRPYRRQTVLQSEQEAKLGAGATSKRLTGSGSRGAFLDHSQGCVEPQRRHHSLRLGRRSSVQEGRRRQSVEPLQRHLLEVAVFPKRDGRTGVPFTHGKLFDWCGVGVGWRGKGKPAERVRSSQRSSPGAPFQTLSREGKSSRRGGGREGFRRRLAAPLSKETRQGEKRAPTPTQIERQALGVSAERAGSASALTSSSRVAISRYSIASSSMPGWLKNVERSERATHTRTHSQHR